MVWLGVVPMQCGNAASNYSLVSFPPNFESTPSKPILFDLAHNAISFNVASLDKVGGRRYCPPHAIVTDWGPDLLLAGWPTESQREAGGEEGRVSSVDCGADYVLEQKNIDCLNMWAMFEVKNVAG